MRLYHGGKVTTVTNQGLFGGVFASSCIEVAKSHCDSVCYTDIDDDNIACNSNIDNDIALSIVSDLCSNDDEIIAIYDVVVFEKDIYNTEIETNRICELLNADDISEASWSAQKIRGEIAAKMGYKAIEMRDEHGTTYLVLPNVVFKNN